MKQKRFKESQIIEFLREGENPDIGVKGVCRRRGISEPTFYRWKKIYGGIDESKAIRLKQLEAENARLRKLMVERDLELDVVRETLKKS